MLILRRIVTDTHVMDHVHHILHLLSLKPLFFFNTVTDQLTDRPNSLVGVVVDLESIVLLGQRGHNEVNKKAI